MYLSILASVILFCSSSYSLSVQKPPKYDPNYYRYDLIQLRNHVRKAQADDPDMLADAVERVQPFAISLDLINLRSIFSVNLASAKVIDVKLI